MNRMLSGAGDWIVHVGAVLVGIAVGIGPTGGESASAAEEGEKKKEEEKVDVYEAEKKKKRPTLKDEEKGPKFGAEDFIARKNFQSVKKQDEAIMRLKDLLESTAKENPERAEILFNLSEMYWNKSKYYEQEAFRKQDQCYKLRDAGKKKEAQACKRQMQRMLDESKRLRKEAAGLYKKIIRNYPNYDQLDDVLYYLGTNLKEVGKHQEALKVFRKLLNNFPDTQYAADVWLSFGDYYFDKKSDPDRALKFYKKVQNFENSDVYAYARYKAAWCYYNLGRKKKALDVFVDVIEYAKAHPDKPNATSLIDQARKDIVLTYADFGSPDKAIPFFRELTGDERKEVMEMAERLAIHYADNAKYDESTEMYRRLIELNKKSIETIDYQYEIVRNYTTQDPYSKKAVKELITLMKLVQYARDGRFEGHDQKTFDEKRTKAEQYVRQWATRYHREAQVTKSEALYKMASYIYKHYLKTFPNSEKIYAMTFFAGELQYHLENWPKAAKLYEKALSLKKDGEYTKEAAHGAVLAYFKQVNTSEKKADLESPLKYEKGDETKEVKQKTQQGPPEKKKLSGVKKDLIGACKRYIEYVPEGERIVDVKYTMARVYYEHNHLRKAIDLFENLAFQHSNHRLAKVAANLHLDSLNLLNDFQGLHKAVERYLSEKPIDSSEFQSNVQRLNRAIRFKLCRKKEQKEAWGKAATCYVNIYRDFPDSKYVDEALYNAALSFERIKELGKAIQIRAFLLKVRPDSEFAPETLFNIGANYHALAVYSRAAQYYERFADKYPDHEKTEKALANAATFRQGLGQYEKAIADNEQYLELFGDEEEHAKKVADVAFQIARIYEKQDKPEEAKEAYETYLEEYADKGTLDRKLQAHVEIGLYHWNHGEREQALEKFRETLAVYNDLSKKQRSKLDEGRDAAARAKFMLGEKIYQEMAEIEVESSDEKELQKRFKKKLKVAKKAQKIYEEVIQFKRPDWAIAALYKIGAQYQDFAETIRNSPPPERLTYRQKQLYKGALEDRASQVEKKAVSAYERALKVAKEQSWFNEYSRKAEIELANLRPKKYRKPSEWSAAPDHLEPGFARADFVEKLKEKEGRLEQLGGSSGGGESSEGGSEASESTSGQSDPRARRRSSTARAAAR